MQHFAFALSYTFWSFAVLLSTILIIIHFGVLLHTANDIIIHIMEANFVFLDMAISEYLDSFAW